MPNTTNMTPVERFSAFFAAEVDGDEEKADRLAREMVDAGGADPQFLRDREAAKAQSRQARAELQD